MNTKLQFPDNHETEYRYLWDYALEVFSESELYNAWRQAIKDGEPIYLGEAENYDGDIERYDIDTDGRIIIS